MVGLSVKVHTGGTEEATRLANRFNDIVKTGILLPVRGAYPRVWHGINHFQYFSDMRETHLGILEIKFIAAESYEYMRWAETPDHVGEGIAISPYLRIARIPVDGMNGMTILFGILGEAQGEIIRHGVAEYK